MDSGEHQNFEAGEIQHNDESDKLQTSNAGGAIPRHEGRSYIPGNFNISGGLAIFGDVYGNNMDDWNVVRTRAEIAQVLSYQGMEDRRRAIASVGKNSFDWVWESGFKSWLQGDAKLFWITGKPGSGKSTMMKHLVENNLTKQILKSSDGQDWNILHFFFDFTSGTDLPNTPEGLLRSWILQLSSYSPKSVTSAPESLSQSVMTDVVVEAFNVEDKYYCAFVDGLDEYEGDVDGLLSLLIDVAQRANIKMCLASRSLTNIELSLREIDVDKLVMQHWNNESIYRYLNTVNDKVAAKRMVPCPPTILNEIASRADGVILWARLALENILQGCNERESDSALLSRLEALPSEIEGLYERALSKITPEAMFEAILYLRAIATTGALSMRDLKALHVVGDIPLPSHFRDRSRDIRALSRQQFEYRLGGLCGGLLITDDEQRFSAVGLSSKALENLINWLLPTAGYDAADAWQSFARFRLIHETLRTYIQTSAYLKSRLLSMTVENDASIDQILDRFVEGKDLRARWKAHAEHYFGLAMLLFYLLLFILFVFILVIGPAYFEETQSPVPLSEQPTSTFEGTIVTMIEVLPLMFLLTAFLAVFTNHALFILSFFLGWVILLVVAACISFTDLGQQSQRVITTMGNFEGIVSFADSLSMFLFAIIFLVAVKNSIFSQPVATVAAAPLRPPATVVVLPTPDLPETNIEDPSIREPADQVQVEKEQSPSKTWRKRMLKLFTRTTRPKGENDP